MNQLTDDGLALIKRYEGFSAKRYLDVTGLATIGWGHLIKASEAFTKITPEEGTALLVQDLQTAQNDITRYISAELNDNQFSALVSLVFNIGPSPLLKTLGRKLNAEDYLGAAEEFTRWVNAGGQPCDGLIRRRAEERALFLKPCLVTNN